MLLSGSWVENPGTRMAKRARSKQSIVVRRALPLLLLSLLLSGCGFLRTIGSPDADGYGENDARLRRSLLVGGFEAALKDLNSAAPQDPLLRDLYTAVVAHYAGEYEASSAALERAAELAEERVATQSVSRAALSALTSDLAMVYEPVEAERLLIHYYNALNYLRRGMADGAAVEARRLSKLLEQLEDDGNRRGLIGTPALRAFAGAVFAAAGERNDAEVAFRQAAHLAEDSTLFFPSPRDSLAEIVVLVELGFVPHRVEQSLNVLLSGEDVAVFGSDDGELKAARATAIAAHVLSEAASAERRYGAADGPHNIFVSAPSPPKDAVTARPKPLCAKPAKASIRAPRTNVTSTIAVRHPGDSTRVAPAPEAETESSSGSGAQVTDGCGKSADGNDEDDDAAPYLLRMAWPVFLGRDFPAPHAVVAVGGTEAPLAVRAQIGDAVVDDFESRRAQLLARAVARATAKLALSKTLEKEVGKKNDGVGKLLGLLTNASSAALERADTRSWHLLPGSIALARVSVPAGTHEVVVRLGSGEHARSIVAGNVTVATGDVSVLSTRIWQ